MFRGDVNSVYSVNDGGSPKIRGQKVMEPKWYFRVSNYMALGIGLVAGKGRTCWDLTAVSSIQASDTSRVLTP